jgi:hypothetical protein
VKNKNKGVEFPLKKTTMRQLYIALRFTLLSLVFFSATYRAQINFTISGVTTATVFNCAVNSITLQATSNFPLPVTYQWANATSTLTGSLVTLSSAGVYTVTAFSNTFTTAQVINVLSDTQAPNLTTSALSVTLNCYTPSVIMTGSTTTARTDIFWIQSSLPTLLQNTLQVQTNTAAVSNTVIGTYTVMATNNMNFCTTQSVITVVQNIFPPVAKLATGNQDPCKTPSVALSNISTTGIPNGAFPNSQAVVVSAWTFISTSTQTLGSSSSITTPSLGTYGLVVTDLNNGCQASAQTASCSSNTGLSITTSKNLDFEIFPNPSSGKLKITSATTAQLIIYNGLGQFLNSFDLEIGQTELNLEQLPQGLYYCRISGVSGHTNTRAVQIVRP